MSAHIVLRKIASWALWSFFSDIYVIDEENVPKDGPIIVHVPAQKPATLCLRARSTCTHHNMIIDPAVLCAHCYVRHEG